MVVLICISMVGHTVDICALARLNIDDCKKGFRSLSPQCSVVTEDTAVLLRLQNGGQLKGKRRASMNGRTNNSSITSQNVKSRTGVCAYWCVSLRGRGTGGD